MLREYLLPLSWVLVGIGALMLMLTIFQIGSWGDAVRHRKQEKKGEGLEEARSNARIWRNRLPLSLAVFAGAAIFCFLLHLPK